MATPPEQLELDYRAAPQVSVDSADHVRNVDQAFAQLEETQRSNLAHALTLLINRPVKLTLTDNSTRMVSHRQTPEGISLRVHHMFLEAGPETIEALASFIHQGDAASSRHLDAFIAEHRDMIAPQSTRPHRLRTAGRYHQLKELATSLNAYYFEMRITAKIAWGRDVHKRRRRHMQLGSYCSTRNLIRIHPALDQKFVPSFYISWVIYHEMLHAWFGLDTYSRSSGKRVLHSTSFELAERRYRDYNKAKAWEGKHLTRLLRY